MIQPKGRGEKGARVWGGGVIVKANGLHRADLRGFEAGQKGGGCHPVGSKLNHSEILEILPLSTVYERNAVHGT